MAARQIPSLSALCLGVFGTYLAEFLELMGLSSDEDVSAVRSAVRSFLPESLRRSLLALARRKCLITDRSLLMLLDENILSLDVSGSGISHNCLREAVKLCPDLRHVDVSRCPGLTEESLRVLVNGCQDLTVLRCGGCPASDAAVRRALPHLVARLAQPSEPACEWEQLDADAVCEGPRALQWLTWPTIDPASEAILRKQGGHRIHLNNPEGCRCFAVARGASAALLAAQRRSPAGPLPPLSREASPAPASASSRNHSNGHAQDGAASGSLRAALNRADVSGSTPLEGPQVGRVPGEPIPVLFCPVLRPHTAVPVEAIAEIALDYRAVEGVDPAVWSQDRAREEAVEDDQSAAGEPQVEPRDGQGQLSWRSQHKWETEKASRVDPRVLAGPPLCGVLGGKFPFNVPSSGGQRQGVPSAVSPQLAATTRTARVVTVPIYTGSPGSKPAGAAPGGFSLLVHPRMPMAELFKLPIAERFRLAYVLRDLRLAPKRAKNVRQQERRAARAAAATTAAVGRSPSSATRGRQVAHDSHVDALASAVSHKWQLGIEPDVGLV